MSPRFRSLLPVRFSIHHATPAVGVSRHYTMASGLSSFTNTGQDQPSARPPYASYIGKTYEDGIFNQKLPLVTTDPNFLEEQARQVMGNKAFGYIYGGAGEMSSVEANHLAFRQWRIVPRVLKPCFPSDLRVNLFGHTYGIVFHICVSKKMFWLTLSFRIPALDGSRGGSRSIPSLW